MKNSKYRNYYKTHLYSNKITTNYIVHRLVAIHFIPNPLNLPCVCHRDETLDEYGCMYNLSDNLWWGTHTDNMQDMYKK